MDLFQTIFHMGILPVIAVKNADAAEPLAAALVRGGLPAAEVTFRTDAAAEVIRRMKAAQPEMLVGAGTILTTEQADRAMEAGAAFLVSPGLNPKVVRHCQEKGVPILPGCANPSDMELALELGLQTVKFFPAEQAGGIAYIKAVSAPYPTLRFMPTGGINAGNLNDYLAFDKVLACGGSWMVRPEWLDAGDFDKVEEATRQAVQALLSLTIRHIGINAQNPDEAADAAAQFAKILGEAPEDGPTSYFIHQEVEVNKKPGRGAMGHIAWTTPSVERSAWHLEQRGFRFDPTSATFDEKGHMKLLYMAQDIGGFAVHLTRK